MSTLRARIINEIPHLRRYARAIIDNDEVADDLVQESLVRAWSKRDKYDPKHAIRPWLFSLLHNVYANNVRHYQRFPSLKSFEHVDQDLSSSDDTVQLAVNDLQRALDQITDDEREIILLVGLAQISYQDCAEMMGVSVDTVISRLARARKHLREFTTDPTMPLSAIQRF